VPGDGTAFVVPASSLAGVAWLDAMAADYCCAKTEQDLASAKDAIEKVEEAAEADRLEALRAYRKSKGLYCETATDRGSVYEDLSEEDAWDEMQRGGPYADMDDIYNNVRGYEKMLEEGYWSSGSNEVSDLVHSFGHSASDGLVWRERPEVTAAREASEKKVMDPSSEYAQPA
jgi:hypothetical protein